MKRIVCLAALLAAGVAVAKDVTLNLDVNASRRAFFAGGAIPVGYAADPKAGDEAAVLAYRHAGAWLFRSSVCDDETLAFLSRYGIKLFLVLDGDLKDMVGAVTRIAKGKYAGVLAGIQLGTDPTGGADVAKWRSLVNSVSRNLPKCRVALPVKDLQSPFLAKMKGYLGPVTHLAVDLRDAPAPYERLNKVFVQLRGSSDKALQKMRLTALAPGRLADAPADKAASPAAIAWQMHWMMAALAVERTDYVFFERPAAADDFGAVMRALWAASARTPHLVGHGESAAIVTAGPAAQQKGKKKTSAPSLDDMSLDDDDSLDAEEMAETLTAGTAPVACANVAAGRLGDLEYLALLADTDKGEKDGGRMCLVIANTSGEQVKLSVKPNTKYGASGDGFRRRFVPDEKTGKMKYILRERFGGVKESIEPGEVTFLSFAI